MLLNHPIDFLHFKGENCGRVWLFSSHFSGRAMRVFPLIGYLWLVVAPVLAEDKASERMADVVNMPGSVAVWDFVKREPG